jgi:hypothetical protein
MTALGWIVVLGPVTAYALLWLVSWDAMKKAQECTDGERTPSAVSAQPATAAAGRHVGQAQLSW